MSNEQLNSALYEKMSVEQDKFRDWLLTQPPEEILKHTYEYTVREDIVMTVEQLSMADGRAAALLTSPSPLADVFEEFQNLETDYMDTIRECIINRANDLCKTQQELPSDRAGQKRSIKEQLAVPPVPGDKPSAKSNDREVR